MRVCICKVCAHAMKKKRYVPPSSNKMAPNDVTSTFMNPLLHWYITVISKSI